MSITLRSGLSLASIAVSLILAGCDNGPQSTSFPSQQPVTLSQTTDIAKLSKSEASADALAVASVIHGNPGLKDSQDNPTPQAAFINPADNAAVTTVTNLGQSQKSANGDSLVRRNDLRVPVYNESNNRRSIAYMLHMSDVQVSDEESPGLTPTNDFVDLQGNNNNGLFQGSYRIHAPYLPHMANELIKSANAVAKKTRDFDISIHTGDAIENAQANELAMFFNLLNGGSVKTDSNTATVNDKGTAALANANINAVGLEKIDGSKAKWLSVVGNHDILGQGNFPLPLLLMFNSNPKQFLALQSIFSELDVTIPNIPVNLQYLGALASKNPAAIAATAGNNVTYRAPLSANRRYLSEDGGVTPKGLNQGTLNLSDLVSWTEMSEIATSYKTDGFVGEQRVQDPSRVPVDNCMFIGSHLDSTTLTSIPGVGAVEGGATGWTYGFSASNAVVIEGRQTKNCHGNYIYDVNDRVRIITLNGANPYGGNAGVIGQPQKPYDLNLMDATYVNPQTGEKTLDKILQASALFSTPSNTSNPLRISRKASQVDPRLAETLFTVLPEQGRAEASLNDTDANTVSFLVKQLKLARKEDRLAIVATHQASEDLVPFNELRTLMETILCGVVDKGIEAALIENQALNLQRLDCNPRGGALGPLVTALGPITDADLANVVSKDLFAKVLTGGQVENYQGLNQQVIDQVIYKRNDSQEIVYNSDGSAALTDSSKQLISGFSLLFNLRQILPDPVEPLDTASFRKLLASYDNVVLHMAGHSHKNEIVGVCSNGVATHSDGQISDPALGNLKSPGNFSCADNQNQFGKGYYEVRTAANADWPLEWRVVEMVDNNDGTLSIYTPVFSFDNATASAEAQLGRRLALTDLATRGVVSDEQPGDRFTELLVNIPAEIDAALDEVNKEGAKPIEALSNLIK